MHFYNLIKELSSDKEIILFVDMDGVIASYDVGKPLDFLHKRPLMTRIKELEEVSKLPNVDIRILSICKKDYQIEEKNIWLDKYAPYFKKENRVIISKETVTNTTSPEIKTNYLNSVKTDKQVVLVDDDNQVLKDVMNNVKGIIVYQDSELVD
ncbi:MAG: hypothetical protein J6I85_09195 [Clostridia bacterium]|nr:hypothetical protein [Clostridia bacterium]